MKARGFGFVLFLLFALPGAGQMETRLYEFGDADAGEVEAQIRRYVPEGPRVLVNPEINQVMVIADAETHRQIAQMLSRIDQPAQRVILWFRHNREVTEVSLLDGAIGTLPVTRTPPEALVREARRFLPGDRRDMPLVGSVLHVHASVLRTEPARVRLRITPAVTFGFTPPYEPVLFEDMATDLMITDEAFLDVVEALRENDFYADFFRSQPEPDHPPRPVGILLSVDRLVSGREAAAEE